MDCFLEMSLAKDLAIVFIVPLHGGVSLTSCFHGT